MTFTLHVDAPLWHAHTASVRDAVRTAAAPAQGPFGARLGDIVPVAKGNGYGFGLINLAKESTRLGVDRIAVGTPYEAGIVAQFFSGDILVMQPWDPRDVTAAHAWAVIEDSNYSHRIVRTIASTEALTALAAGADPEAIDPPRVVIEGLTSMRRFGLGEPDMSALLAEDPLRNALRHGAISLQGLALHLPIAQPRAPHVETLENSWHETNPTPQLPEGATGRVREAWSWALTWIRALGTLEDAGCPMTDDAAALWVSHLDDSELGALRSALPDLPLRVRVGTRLWLGSPDAAQARGTVLAVHPVNKGRAVGYRQKGAPKEGFLVVVGGGTAHGVAMEAPTPAVSMRQRAVAVGTGALEATGRNRSPFNWDGKRRWFAEPPHMQVSMLWVSAEDVRQAVGRGGRVPAVGEELPCRVRNTTALFDRIIGLD